ncbi:MAG: alpha/beta hydrolase family protein [Paenibacillaceae bacterium]|jgi:pimeloyl-ACP methyl ester carboxylesterase|nr:alpha/beta hydrolase family protein [Paenibacillaceae bacterium]
MDLKIMIDGIGVNYTVAGSGRDVLLLHGWGASLQSYTFILESLVPKFRVFALDLPGFGASGEPSVPWGVDEYYRCIARFIELAGINNPVIIGHSHGGRIAIRYAADNPVHKLVLVDAAGIKPKRSFKYYLRVYSYKSVKHLLSLPVLRRYKEGILAKYRGKVGSTDYKNASDMMRRTLVRLVNEDLKVYMPRLKAPTLLIWGENDTATPLSHGRIMEKLIPNAGLVVLKNAGHWSFVEKPREFLIILHNFLAND